MWRVLFAVLLAAGCIKSVGDTLVVVTVDAVPALTNVELLHTVSMAGGEQVIRDVGGDGPVFALGGGETKDFGVQLRAAITGSFGIHVEAHDGSGNVLGQGDAAGTLVPGKRIDLTVTLGPGTAPDGGMDGGGADGGTDGGSTDLAGPDLLGPPPPAVPIWIASGGASTAGNRKLQLSVGGFIAPATMTAPSGRTLGSYLSTSK